MTIKYQAYGKGSQITRDTPRAAALAYFEQEPNRRKCDVTAGRSEGGFFTRIYSLRHGTGPTNWSDVTPKTALELPNVASESDSAPIPA
ncbi:MAG: hypothetical protein E5W82_10585 [Mesorhizobium sp.]|nr:MAG: hypothetical protein E5W82_10585 [Mesorhizobium sp.]